MALRCAELQSRFHHTQKTRSAVNCMPGGGTVGGHVFEENDVGELRRTDGVGYVSIPWRARDHERGCHGWGSVWGGWQGKGIYSGAGFVGGWITEIRVLWAWERERVGRGHGACQLCGGVGRVAEGAQSRAKGMLALAGYWRGSGGRGTFRHL